MSEAKNKGIIYKSAACLSFQNRVFPLTGIAFACHYMSTP